LGEQCAGAYKQNRETAEGSRGSLCAEWPH
jgi:hypothetical protein